MVCYFCRSLKIIAFYQQILVELVRNLVTNGDAREGKWRGNWRMEWVASTLTPPPNMVYAALLKLMLASRLPAVDWTEAPTDLNGLVPFGERRNLVSARVPSRSERAITLPDIKFQVNPSSERRVVAGGPPTSLPACQPAKHDADTVAYHNFANRSNK